MALSFEQKKVIVSEVAVVAKDAHSAVVAEYRGMRVEELTALRKDARTNGVYLRVIKNSLARRAVEGTAFECMSEGMTGPLIYAFSQQDPGCAARVIKGFVKGNDKLIVKMVSIGGELLDASELDRLSKLPTYDEAISLLMSVMKAPIQKLTSTLNEVPGKLVRTVAAIKDAKQAA